LWIDTSKTRLREREGVLGTLRTGELKGTIKEESGRKERKEIWAGKDGIVRDYTTVIRDEKGDEKAWDEAQIFKTLLKRLA